MKEPEISVEEFKSALVQKNLLRKGDNELLIFLYNQPDQRAAVVEIAEFLGKSHFVEINGAFGRLGNRIADYLDKEELFDYAGWYLIATGEKESNNFVWQLRPNFVTALEKLNIVSAQTYELPEIKGDDGYEGMRRRVMYDVTERDKEARDKCIAFYHSTCQLCGFNGVEKYGTIGEGIIHAHHIISFKEKRGPRVTNPEKDLIALCPNCHSLVHKKDPPYSIDELKKLIKK